MAKIDWTKPIELEDGTPLVATGYDREGGYKVERVDGLAFPHNDHPYMHVKECGTWRFGDISIRNTPEQETLHIDPTPDNFQTESPIRAFTDWRHDGLYAVGRGFRPSMAHLARYLDAMETREDWRLVQILEAAEKSPSFVFRKV